jgi:hypothetical protein
MRTVTRTHGRREKERERRKRRKQQHDRDHGYGGQANGALRHTILFLVRGQEENCQENCHFHGQNISLYKTEWKVEIADPFHCCEGKGYYILCS